MNRRAFDYYIPLQKIRAHFEENYTESISLADAAAMVGLETKHFGKYFKNKVGITFKTWTESFRIERAIEMMRIEHQSILDVALAVGFRDLRTFERVFKKHVKMTPREFRKSVILDVHKPA